jgi:hypothetical protein
VSELPDLLLARIVAAREAVLDGGPIYADELLTDLERDHGPASRYRCECGRSFRFPGELVQHEFEAHAWRRTA